HGAHGIDKIRKIDNEAIELLTSLGRGAVTLVTLAPEMTSTVVIEQLSAAGVVVFAGHSEADYEQCQRAVDAGLSGFTHLFNAMPPLMGRAPGIVGAALDLDSAVVSVIADGHHVHPASLRVALGAKRRGQVVLVSDAMPTVGSTLTEFRLGGQRVELKDGVLRNRRGSLAGSHLNMLEAVRNVISLTGNHWTEAVRMASSYPARAIGVADRRGFLARGYRADLVELNEDMSLHRTWVSGAPPERD
ncbi:MAG: N-acetylglucosamine-6-phosphate deacetylase, partial [Proteobacteria bacterium]|nr:N-acetylglucosamine-6-phosphate deacetylase [Pseudomonadota bacterium]